MSIAGELDIKGAVHADIETRGRNARDQSGYRVVPELVVVPEEEGDVEKTLGFALQHGLPVTCRGAGSNLSGSAVGPGILISCRNLDAVNISGRKLFAAPGAVYARVNRETGSRGLSLRYDVSSGSFSTLGGNVATRAGGLRSIKYGTVDRALTGVRFFCPAYGRVDTRTPDGVPAGLAAAVGRLRGELLGDQDTVRFLEERRGLKSSSGYNLHALIDHDDPRDIVTHLVCGSAGTLGVITGLEMQLVPLPEERAMFAAFFRGLDEAAEAAVQASQTGVSALEHMDRFGVDLIEGLQTIPVPDGAGAVLLAETEENPGRLGRTLESLALSTSRIKGPDAEAVWKIRWTMLSRIRRVHEDGNHRFISFVDDLAVPAAQLPRFAREVCRIFDAEDLLTIIYGHIGEGNLHIRPLVARKDWQDTVARIGEKCFDACLELGGTLTAEHGPGRNRCPYIEKEWGTAADWFIKVKKLFDPEMLLNPGVLFECGSVTDHYAF